MVVVSRITYSTVQYNVIIVENPVQYSVQDHLGYPLAGGDGGHGPAPLPPALAVQAVGHQGQALAEHRRHATWQPHVSRGGP